MNVEYIGYPDVTLDSHFYNGHELTSSLNEMFKTEGFVKDFTTLGYYDGSSYYRSFNLDSNGDYQVSIVSVHENGVALQVKCIIDAGSAKYNTATSAMVIFKDGELPKFVIDGIDGRVNTNVDNPNNSFWISVNQEIVERLISELGKRVDGPLVGTKPKDNILTRRLNQKNEALARTYVDSRIEHVGHVLDALEDTIDYRRGK